MDGRQIKSFIAVIFSLLALSVVSFVWLFIYTFNQNNKNSDVIEKTTIEIMSPWIGMNKRAIALDDLISKYYKVNPNVKIVNKSVAPDVFYEKLNMDFASGVYSDVIIMPPNYTSEKYINMGYILPLDDVLDQDQQWKVLFDKSTLKYVTFNDKIYAMPFEVIYQAVFYNTDLFDKYNIKYPEDYESLMAAAEKFKANGIIPVAMNFKKEGSYFIENVFSSYFLNIKKKDLNAPESKEKFNKVISIMKELYKSDMFPENAFSLDDFAVRDLFLNQKAAMIVDESTFISELIQIINNQYVAGEKDKVDKPRIKMGCFPHIPEGKADGTALLYGLGEGTFFVTNKVAQENRTDEVFDFLKFLSQPDQAKFFSEQTYTISAIKALNSNAYYSDQMQQGFTLINKSKQLIGPPSLFFGTNNWDALFINKMPYVLDGKLQAEDIWNDLKELEYD